MLHDITWSYHIHTLSHKRYHRKYDIIFLNCRITFSWRYVFLVWWKVTNIMKIASTDLTSTLFIKLCSWKNCIGSAIVAMGLERILTLIPISVHAENFTCSNVWLVPILKKHVVGASLGYYMEYIVPLAKSFMQDGQNGMCWYMNKSYPFFFSLNQLTLKLQI